MEAADQLLVPGSQPEQQAVELQVGRVLAQVAAGHQLEPGAVAEVLDRAARRAAEVGGEGVLQGANEGLIYRMLPGYNAHRSRYRGKMTRAAGACAGGPRSISQLEDPSREGLQLA